MKAERTVATDLPVLLSIAFPYAPVGCRAVGGAEVICSQMEAAIEAVGFRSVVVAHAASQTHGRLYATQIPEGSITEEVRLQVERSHQENIDRALADHPVALVHMHGLDFARYRVPVDVPVLVTLHLPPGWYPAEIWDLPEQYHFVCVSESQRRACPERAQKRLRVVENGVPLPEPDEGLRRGGRYALMLARICPEKNLHVGLDAARLAGVPAMLGGEVFPYPEHERYFHEVVEPRVTASGALHQERGRTSVDEVDARFLGPVSGAEKARLLRRAACLLLPSLAPETSSLVAMEALAAGVPVIGMRVGAVPEIVDDGVTGFLIDPGDGATEAMAEAIRRVAALDRAACRSAARERFPFERMLDGYAALYRALATHPRSCSPRLGATVDAAEDNGHLQPQRRSLRAGDLLETAVTDGAALSQLETEWAAAWAADETATPFQHPAWLLPWWDAFGAEGELCARVYRTRDSGKLTGLLPVYVYPEPASGQRKLLFAGAGTSDYLGGVWRIGTGVPGGELLRAALRSTGDWDVCSLHQIRQGSWLLDAAASLPIAVEPAEPVSVVDVSAPLPAKLRVNIGRYRRMATDSGDALALEVASDPEGALQAFEELRELHSQRWQRRGEDGVLHDPRVLAHHRGAIPKLLQAGLVRMFRLRLGGETVGVLYALADGLHRQERRLYLYLIGFDERFSALSPGTLLVDAVWHYAREHRFSRLDLLRGGEAYKALWGAVQEDTFALQVMSGSIPGAGR